MSAGGASLALSIIPQQLISLATAVAYGLYVTHFASLLILTQMVQKILQKEGVESWHFFGARFDGTAIWAAPLMPKFVGYKSPKRHLAVAILVLLVPLVSVTFHSIAIVGAIGIATAKAFGAGGFLLKTAGLMAALIAVTSAVGLAALLFFRMPFRRDMSPERQSQST